MGKLAFVTPDGVAHMKVDNWTWLTEEQVTSVGRARYVYGTSRDWIFILSFLVFVSIEEKVQRWPISSRCSASTMGMWDLVRFKP
jgi:hypothetical protein